MALDSLTYSDTGGILTIRFSDNDFSPVDNIGSSMGGINAVGANILFKLYANSSNIPLDINEQPLIEYATSSSSYSYQATALPSAAAPFSMTLEAVITHPSGNISSGFDYEINTAVCNYSDYKVSANLNLPSADNLTAPNWSYAQAAGVSGALNANLKFDFIDADAGSFGTAYRIIVKKQATEQAILDTGKCTGYNTPSATPVKCKLDIPCLINSNTCTLPLNQTDGLDYNTAYKWSVKVWDNENTESSFKDYNTNPDFPPEADDHVVPTFTTYMHEFPIATSTPFPAKPSKGELVKFTDASQRHTTSDPAAPVDCTVDTCDWQWTLPLSGCADFAPGIDGNDSSTSTPIIIFNNTGPCVITLQVSDQGDTGDPAYYEKIDLNTGVNVRLPKWKEVKPE